MSGELTPYEILRNKYNPSKASKYSGVPQYSHSDLVARGKRWLLTYSGNSNHYRCGFVLTEYRCFAKDEVPDVIGFRFSKSVLIECKTSRQDFFSDKDKPHRRRLKRLGNMRLYLVPAGLVSKDEVPEGWGLLFAHDKRITIELAPPYHSLPEIKIAEYTILYSLLRRAEIRGLIPKLLVPLLEYRA